jgi:polyhydroxyalkanoate synthesis regulator phasin
MEQGKVTKQMIQFNKAAFDNTFNAMTVLHDHTEKIVNNFLEQSPWMPAEGKKAITDWIKAYKQGREEFKANVDDNYRKVEEYFAGFDKGKTT